MTEPDTNALRCWAEIDLGAIRANAALLRKRAGGAPLLCVVKANGYGHGARAVTQALQAETNWFAVANVKEGADLADLPRPDDRVVILGPALPAERAEIAERGFIPILSSVAEAEAYAAIGQARGKSVPVHVKLDTGMGRMGLVDPGDLLKINALPGLEVRGVTTHLPSADSDLPGTQAQLAEFGRILADLETRGLPRLPFHAQNSAGFLHNLEAPGRPPGWVRPGLTLYGVSPTGEAQGELRRALTWKTHIVLIRELPAGHGVSYASRYRTTAPTRVATLSAGYADGYPRTLTCQGADVLIGGRRCPVLGTVTMDLLLVDVTALPDARPGDEAILLGRDATSGEEIAAEELAQKAGTIAWEIFTNLSPRVARVYV
jgi:alanine racemase